MGRDPDYGHSGDGFSGVLGALQLLDMAGEGIEFVREAGSRAQVRHLVDRGLPVAMARNGVTVLILPKDVQDMMWNATHC